MRIFHQWWWHLQCPLNQKEAGPPVNSGSPLGTIWVVLVAELSCCRTFVWATSPLHHTNPICCRELETPHHGATPSHSDGFVNFCIRLGFCLIFMLCHSFRHLSLCLNYRLVNLKLVWNEGVNHVIVDNLTENELSSAPQELDVW